MKHLFVPYELAIILKEKGFKESCFGVYYNKDGDVRKITYSEYGDAPLYQQAFDWIFKKLDFMYPYMSIEMFSDGSGMWYHPADDGKDNKLEIDFDNINEAIEEALKLI